MKIKPALLFKVLIYQSIYLLIHSSITCLSVHLLIHSSITHLSVHLLIHSSITYLSVRLLIHSSIIYLSVHLYYFHFSLLNSLEIIKVVLSQMSMQTISCLIELLMSLVMGLSHLVCGEQLLE